VKANHAPDHVYVLLFESMLKAPNANTWNVRNTFCCWFKH